MCIHVHVCRLSLTDNNHKIIDPLTGKSNGIERENTFNKILADLRTYTLKSFDMLVFPLMLKQTKVCLSPLHAPI